MYKFYYSKADIFWNSVDGVDKFNYESNIDTYCNFIEIPQGQGAINFIDWLTATTISPDKEITYYKVEKINPVTNQPDETIYYFVRGVNRVLSKGYELNLVVDTWMTYSRHVMSEIVRTNKEVLVNRMTLTNSMWNEKTKHYFRAALTNIDELVDNIAPLDVSLTLHKKEYDMNNRVYFFENGTGDFYNIEFPTRNPVNRDRNISPYGLCAVFLDKDAGIYLIFPYQHTNNPLMEITVKGVKKRFNNSPEWIERYLISKAHQNMTFLGLFRNVPLGMLKQEHFGNEAGWNVYHTKDSQNNGVYFLYLKIAPELGIQMNLPKAYNIMSVDNSFVKSATELHNKLFWSNQPRRIKDFIMDEAKEINPKYQIFFNNDFVFYPKNDKYLLTSRVLSFGNALPSATSDYNQQQLASRARYDSGLVSSIGQVIAGIAGAKYFTPLVESAAYLGDNLARHKDDVFNKIWNHTNPYWDFMKDGFGKAYKGQLPYESEPQSSGFGTLGVFGLGAIGRGISNMISEGIRHNYQSYLNQATYYNSDTQTIYWSNLYISLLESNFGNDVMFEPNSKSASKLIHPLIEIVNGERTKYQIARTYNMYGFPLNCYVNITNCVRDAGAYNKLYIDINEAWLIENIRYILTEAKRHGNLRNEAIKLFTPDVMDIVVRELSGGIRIWTKNKIDFDDFNDWTPPTK